MDNRSDPVGAWRGHLGHSRLSEPFALVHGNASAVDCRNDRRGALAIGAGSHEPVQRARTADTPMWDIAWSGGSSPWPHLSVTRRLLNKRHSPSSGVQML